LEVKPCRKSAQEPAFLQRAGLRKFHTKKL